MHKLLKYFFVLVAAVAFAACSSDDEPATGPEYMPELNGEVNYEFLTNLSTSTDSRLFGITHTWFYRRDLGETDWGTPSTVLLGGSFDSQALYYFHKGNVYHDASFVDLLPENNEALMSAYISQLYDKHYGVCNLWIKSKFEFSIGKRSLGIVHFGQSQVYNIESTGADSFTISYTGTSLNESEYYHVAEFVEVTDQRYTANSLFFDNLRDLVVNILEKEEALAGETDVTKRLRLRLELGLYDDLSSYYSNPEKWWEKLHVEMANIN